MRLPVMADNKRGIMDHLNPDSVTVPLLLLVCYFQSLSSDVSSSSHTNHIKRLFVLVISNTPFIRVLRQASFPTRVTHAEHPSLVRWDSII